MNEKKPPEPFGNFIADKKTRDLVDACLSSVATEEQRDQLSKLIVESQEACDYYIAQCTMVSQLLTYSKNVQDIKPELPTIERPQSNRHMISGWIIAIAASVLIVFIGSYSQWNTRDNVVNVAQSEVVGEMLSEIGIEQTKPVALIMGKRVSIESGSSEVRLLNDVSFSIAAPASFVIETANQCRVWQGKMTVSVPVGAKGFRVVTDHADIVDQGTRFGVAVNPETGTDVAVFEGRVDLASQSAEKRLEVGRAATIATDGSMSRMQLVRIDTFEASNVSEDSKESTISSVQDNIHSSDVFGYYRIVPNGFGEEQPAYVDRGHQWNGVTADGLPRELLGGDYVMPFNNDKVEKEIEVTITLSRAANLYVLFDKRAEIPKWLSDRFVDTGEEAGQDEGGEVPGFKTHKRTTIGSGVSIDAVFSVWKSHEPLKGDIVLGGLWADKPETTITTAEEISMYGVVAVPVLD
ncbi:MULTISPECIES: FecR domain-containing protein [Pirellulaceae]|uniref:FecR domain-containing protein n=1 Tax=Pirellulaceae TaxID=2691357 RepID=UPI001304F7FD|nr:MULTISPECIES: FecR domain-containing protein [Pirellulaceae]